MFDLGASELLLVVIVAVIVIGPKDLPLAMRTAGRWIGKVRRLSGHFRAGIDAMVREAELEEMEKKWQAQNEAIMKASPEEAALASSAEGQNPPEPTSAEWIGQEPETEPLAASAESAVASAPAKPARADVPAPSRPEKPQADPSKSDEPQLPL